ncbi:hypothetical protein FQR65_LT09742 [Abscondita terminalis]|nr:hypothetical protein FQR65_LT09742 [Abscondita terminalis]
MEETLDESIPQWKRELIARIRNKNKWYSAAQQLLAGTPRNASAEVGCTVQQPSITCSSASVPVVNPIDVVNVKRNVEPLTCTQTKMVKERVFVDHNQINNYLYENDNGTHENGDDSNSLDSNSSEELHYGPGIVNKLKNRYLSLTLRENNVKSRPSILPIRKATSLEHLLDEEVPNGKAADANTRTYNSRWKENNAKNASNRYNTKRTDLKRARSVETISRSTTDEDSNELINDVRVKHKSLHEDMLIIQEGNDKLAGKTFDNNILEITETKPFSNAVPHIINRPKRITPVMSEKEKPPVDVVRQTKKLFEGKAEQRTKPRQQTGEVAAKVASYKNIIGQTKNSNKPPIVKEKPVLPENKKPIRSPENTKLQKPSKLPVIGCLENGWKKEDKSPSPDVALIRSISSPIPDVSRINSINKDDAFNIHPARVTTNLSETPDLIIHSSPIKNPSSPTFRILATDDFLKAEVLHSNNNFKIKRPSETLSPTKIDVGGIKTISPESRNKIRQAGNTTTYNLSSSTNFRSHLPTTNSDAKVLSPPPIKNTHINKLDKTATINQLVNPVSISKPISPTKVNLTPQEIEKNNINKAKTLEQKITLSSPLFVKCDEVKKVEVPKAALPKGPKEQNSIVFKFTDRKDVPDYVGNDGRIRSQGKIEKPKVGEGGIILLPGASIDESFTDEDDWMLSLEGPPSPCDVVFVNDNVLIDGRSSLSQKHKKSKMKLKFVESVPEIFEYPSEASLLDELLQSPLRDTSSVSVVPNISGSSLANYIPKAGTTEDFQLGITRSIPAQTIVETKNSGAYIEAEMQQIDEPILFSAGTNSDILF